MTWNWLCQHIVRLPVFIIRWETQRFFHDGTFNFPTWVAATSLNYKVLREYLIGKYSQLALAKKVSGKRWRWMQNWRALRNNNKIKAVAMTCENMLRPKTEAWWQPPIAPFLPLWEMTVNSPRMYIYMLCIYIYIYIRCECAWWAVRGEWVCKICKDATSTALSVKFLYKLQHCVDADVDATWRWQRRARLAENKSYENSTGVCVYGGCTDGGLGRFDGLRC